MKLLFLFTIIVNTLHPSIKNIFQEYSFSCASVVSFGAVGYFSHKNKFNKDHLYSSKLLAWITSNIGECLLKKSSISLSFFKLFAPVVGYYAADKTKKTSNDNEIAADASSGLKTSLSSSIQFSIFQILGNFMTRYSYHENGDCTLWTVLLHLFFLWPSIN